MAGHAGQARTAAAAARRAFWRHFGLIDDDAATEVGPAFAGGPRWPSIRHGWVIIRRPGSVIVASDGLSDPDAERPEYRTGHDGELFVEIADRNSIDLPAAVLAATPAVQALRQVADAMVEQDRSIADRHRRWGLHTMSVTVSALPQRWQGPDGTLGVLIGKRSPELPIELELPAGTVRIAALTPMTPAETAAVLLDWEGRARGAAAAAMDRSGSGHLFDLERR
ncbi:hypothetical protein [Nakamurella lactea]|uniref:hypothetical protein n=1 Tax=Nakamurella lactea TaxID=459515 RepID=UPI00040C8564|nr:hypothetical protein [Nakamurella lactea]